MKERLHQPLPAPSAKKTVCPHVKYFVLRVYDNTVRGGGRKQCWLASEEELNELAFLEINNEWIYLGSTNGIGYYYKIIVSPAAGRWPRKLSQYIHFDFATHQREFDSLGAEILLNLPPPWGGVETLQFASYERNKFD